MPFDIGIGIILTIIFGQLYGIEITASFVLVGIIASLLPDMVDGVPNIKKMFRGHAHEHRDGAHYPILFLFTTFLIAWLVLPWGISGAFIFTIIVLVHFIHDMIGVGWGIQLFHPFSKKFIKLCTPTYRNGDTKRRLYAVWTKEEMHAVAKEYGRDDWIVWYYGKHIGGYIEWVTLTVGVGYLLWVF